MASGPTTRTPDLDAADQPTADTQAVGALAIAPSNDSIVYMGSGEGALSGDSYYGDGIYRSADGGVTWQHVSTLFAGQAVSDIVVDPADPQHLYASTVRGRGGNHRTSAPTNAPYGVYESTDGGATWAAAQGRHRRAARRDRPRHGPAAPAEPLGVVLGRRHLPVDQRWRDLDVGAGRPAGRQLPRGRHPLRARDLAPGRRRLTDAVHRLRLLRPERRLPRGPGLQEHRRRRPLDRHRDRLGHELDPGLLRHAVLLRQRGGARARPTPTSSTSLARTATTSARSPAAIFRSTNGGATWKNLGYDLHPDYHAFAFQPNDTKHIAIGNDGGVWQSHTGGGATAPPTRCPQRTGRTSTAPWTRTPPP